MAQIDLRNVTIQIKDGYSGPGGTGLVNLMAGYASGLSTMAVDGFTGAVAVGDTFTVAGDTVVHTITAHSETSLATTSITFTPALGSSVVDDAAITVRPHALSVKIGDGNLTYDEKRAFKYILDRGRLSTVRLEDDVPLDVKIDAIWEFLKADSGDTPTIEDVLKQRGQASAWVTSSSDPCEVYAVDLILSYDPPCTGEKDEIITLSDFRWEQFSHDLKAGMLSLTGKCNVTVADVQRV